MDDWPIYPPFAGNPAGRASLLRRDVNTLQRRSVGVWHIVSSELGYQNSWVDSGGTWVTSRFRRLALGGYEYILNVKSGTPHTTIATLPDGFFDTDGDLPLHGFDDTGTTLALKIVAATGGGFNAGDIVHVGP